MPKKIFLPRIEHVRILNYALYPGKASRNDSNTFPGLDHAFAPGITVAVGINGLGKTTFLNALLFGLVGRKLLPKAEQVRLGVGKFSLTEPSRIPFFTDRVTDNAKSATLEIAFRLGKTTINVKRKLSNLSIEELQIGKLHITEPTEDRYLEAVAESAGLADPYQFHVVIKYLLFFLEGYVPLLWDRESQFEMLRILFVDEDIARQLADLKREVMTLDSRLRNYRAVLNQLTAQYGDSEETEPPAIEQLETELRALEQLARGTDDHFSDLEKQRLEQFDQLQQLHESKFRIDVEIAETERKVRLVHDDYLRTLSPSMDDTVRVLLGTLLEGGGCGVCGSRDEETRLRVQHDLTAERCPICHSPKDAHEERPVTPIESAALKRLLDGLSAKRQVSFDLGQHIAAETDSYTILQQQVQEAAKQRQDAASRVQKTLSKLPPQDEAALGMRRRLLENRALVETLKTDLDRKYKAYVKLVKDANDDLARTTSRIRKIFSYYAKQFLQETAELEYKQIRVSLGQEHKVLLPSFSVKMTSGVDIHTPLIRGDESAVSESQREFLELAFRMALMTVATRGRDRGLLVMETPEASLDAIFIRRAAKMLRQFSGGKRSNGAAQVIASSNISGAEMIQALLGFDSKHPARNQDARRQQVINMLDIAAPNAAYRRHKQEYDELFSGATGL